MGNKLYLLWLLLVGFSWAQMAYCADEPTNLVGPYEAEHAFKALSPRDQMVEQIQEAASGNEMRLNPPMSPTAGAKPHCPSKVSATESQIDEFVERFQESPILEDGLHDPSLRKLIQNEMATQRGRRVVLPIAHASMSSLPTLKYPASMQHPAAEQNVDMAVAVSKDGHVSALLVICADTEALIDTAVHAGQAFQFRPAMLDGKPVADVVVVPFTFKP